LGDVLAGVSALFRARRRASEAVAASPSLLDAIDRAMAALLGTPEVTARHEALLALVGMRCNLFPAAPAFADGTQR
jgi:hypothetical protein